MIYLLPNSSCIIHELQTIADMKLWNYEVNWLNTLIH